LGRITSWVRDVQGRVTAKIYPDNTQAAFTYENTTSRLRYVTDAKNQVTGYSYFGDNHLKQISYTNCAIATPTITFSFDTNYDRLASMIDGVGTDNYSYYAITNIQLGAG